MTKEAVELEPALARLRWFKRLSPEMSTGMRQLRAPSSRVFLSVSSNTPLKLLSNVEEQLRLFSLQKLVAKTSTKRSRLSTSLNTRTSS